MRQFMLQTGPGGRQSRRLAAAASAVLCLALLTACSPAASTASAGSSAATAATAGRSGSTSSTANTSASAVVAAPVAVEFSGNDLDAGWDQASATTIALNGATISVTGTGAAASAGTVTITAAGTYIIRGQLTDGQVIVDSTDDDVVRLVLDGASITCSTSAPIYVKDAKKVILILADGTANQVADGASYILADATVNEPNAAIFSKADLTINGSGSLTVDANYKQGITSKDELKIVSGNLTVNAVTQALNGRDFVAVKDGTITVRAGNDGIKSNNDEDPTLGFVSVEGGQISVTAGEDGIQGETQVVIRGGSINLTTGGGSANSINKADNGPKMPGQASTTAGETAEVSAKGLKAAVAVTINGGTVQIDSADDTIHANQAVTINGGSIDLTAGDDGIHADSSLAINGGLITINQSYEGIESARIVITNGTIHIKASDDGVNIAGGVDGSSIGGRPGQDSFATSSGQSLTINGGTIAVDAGGDGLDINGSITIGGGTVLINGPTNNGNGALDYDSGFQMTGGFLVAAGSSGMAMAPDTSSTQYTLMVNFDTAQTAGNLVNISSTSGESIVTFAPTKTYQSIVVCSPAISKGQSYVVSTGGRSSGTVQDSLYSSGQYSGGTPVTTLTASGVVTQYGSSGGFGPGGGGGGGGGVRPGHR